MHQKIKKRFLFKKLFVQTSTNKQISLFNLVFFLRSCHFLSPAPSRERHAMKSKQINPIEEVSTV